MSVGAVSVVEHALGHKYPEGENCIVHFLHTLVSTHTCPPRKSLPFL